MKNYTFHFDCKHKFGMRVIKAETVDQAKAKAVELIKGGAWCENRCDTCKLKVTQ